MVGRLVTVSLVVLAMTGGEPATAGERPCEFLIEKRKAVGDDDLRACHEALRADIDAAVAVHVRREEAARSRAEGHQLIAALLGEIDRSVESLLASDLKPGLRPGIVAYVKDRLEQLARLVDGGSPGAAGLTATLQRLEREIGALDLPEGGDVSRRLEQSLTTVRNELDQLGVNAGEVAPSWRARIPSTAQAEAQDPSKVDVKRYLLAAVRAHKKLARIARGRGEDVRGGVGQVDAALDAALKRTGLSRRFTGVLAPTTGIARAGDGGADTSGVGTAIVRFESRHLGWGHVHINGAVGGDRVFTMYTPEAAKLSDTRTITTTRTASGTSITQVSEGQGRIVESCNAGPDGSPVDCRIEPVGPAPKYQNALVWQLGVGTGFPLRSIGEIGLVGRAGQALLTPQTTVVKSGDIASLGVPADAGRAARWSFEAGARLVVFQDRFADVHEYGVLRPLFSVEYGWRWDNRFRNQAALQPFGPRPDQRQYLRFGLSGLGVFSDQGKTFTLSLAVEHEWAGFRKEGLPAGTKILVQGNVDLLNALTGKSGEK